MSSKKFNPSKDLQSDQIQRSSLTIFHCSLRMQECRFEFETIVAGTTDGFIFQIITSLIESWGVRLTCFDCNIVPIVVLVLESKRLCQRVCEQTKLKSKNCKLTYLSIMSICSEYLCCCHLILGQSASFIGANHTSTAKRLHNRKLLYDSISSSHSHYTQG